MSDDENFDHAKSRYVLKIFYKASIFSDSNKCDVCFPYFTAVVYHTMPGHVSKLEQVQIQCKPESR